MKEHEAKPAARNGGAPAKTTDKNRNARPIAEEKANSTNSGRTGTPTNKKGDNKEKSGTAPTTMTAVKGTKAPKSAK